MDPWLTNKDGKQDAKEDDDERELEEHESDRDVPLTKTTGLPQECGNAPQASVCPEHCQVGMTA